MNTDSSVSGCLAAVSSVLAFLYWHLSLEGSACSAGRCSRSGGSRLST